MDLFALFFKEEFMIFGKDEKEERIEKPKKAEPPVDEKKLMIAWIEQVLRGTTRLEFPNDYLKLIELLKK